MSKRSRRVGAQIPIGKLLDSVLEGYGLGEDLREHRIVAEWPSLIGKRVASRTWPSRIDAGVLFVRVSNSAWLQELSFLKDELVERINDRLGDPPVVTDLRFHLGSTPRAHSAEIERARTRSRRPKLRRRPLPAPARGGELARITAEVGGAVEEPELRNAILEARRKLNV